MSETTNTLVRIIEQSGLEKSKADYLLEKFADATALAQQWQDKAKQIVVTDESQTDLMKSAREGRLLLKDKRVEIEKTRKQLKEASLAEGRAIDSIAKALTALIAPTEDYLQEQETFKERKEAQRKNELRERRMNEIVTFITTDDLVGMGDLGEMSENQFGILFTGIKATYEKRVENERKEREEFLAKEKADAEAREAQRIENERLKKEAEEREKAFAAERKAAQEKADKERAELQRIQREQEDILRKEREAREKADAELKAQKQKEEQAQLKLIEEREALEAAPDKEKIKDLIKRLREFELPDVKGKKAKAIIQAASNKITELIDNITETSNKL